MAFAFDNGFINHFYLRDVLSTRLQNVIDRYDFPSQVFIDSCNDGMCSTKLIYMTSGMAVELFLDWDRDAEGDVTVTPDSEVKGIEFFAPGEKGYLTAYPQYSQSFPRWSSPWVGYTKYSFRR